MPCTEITEAIDWNKKTGGSYKYPVLAFFTRHFGIHLGTPSALSDVVHYASGEVTAQGTPVHLKGTLKGSKSKSDGQMVSDPTVSYDVEIFPDGKLTYRLGNTQPVTVQATCVNDVLLTATHDSTFLGANSEVVSVGVALRPKVVVSVP